MWRQTWSSRGNTVPGAGSQRVWQMLGWRWDGPDKKLDQGARECKLWKDGGWLIRSKIRGRFEWRVDGVQQLSCFMCPASSGSFSDICCLCRNTQGILFLRLCTKPERNWTVQQIGKVANAQLRCNLIHLILFTSVEHWQVSLLVWVSARSNVLLCRFHRRDVWQL